MLARRKVAAKIIDFVEKAELPDRHKFKKLSTLTAQPLWNVMFEEVRTMVDAGGIGAVISEVRGTGKTQMAVECVKHLARKLRSSRYIHCQKMFMVFRRCFRDGCTYTEEQAIQQFVRPGLLVIDETQDRKHSDFENTHLTLVIDERYGKGRPTILLGNYKDRAAFAESVGPSVYSRIEECGHIWMPAWASLRGTP